MVKMKHKVTKRQYNSRMCLVCGMDNDLGLKTRFYEIDSGELVGLFLPKEEYQSYPERLHGGISSAILDEIIGRAINIEEPDVWGVTVELNLKFKKPIPLDKEIKAVGRITKANRKLFEGTGEIILENGEVAVQAYGKYLKLPVDKITNTDFVNEGWKVDTGVDNTEEIEI